MLVAHATSEMAIYTCVSNPRCVYNILAVQKEIGEAKRHLVFIHAVSGCDSVSLMWSRQKESFPTNAKRCQQLSVSGLFLKSRKHQRRDCQCRRMIHSSTVWCAEDSVTRQIPLHCLQSCYWKDITVVIIQTGVFTSHKYCSKAAFVQNISYCSAVAGE